MQQEQYSQKYIKISDELQPDLTKINQISVNSNNIIQTQSQYNQKFITKFIIFINIPGLLIGYVLAYQNQVSQCFNTKFDWNTEQTQNYYQGLLGASVVLGMTLGAVQGGVLMVIGRRRALLIAGLIGIIGISITFYLNLYTLLLGRFLFGFSCGLMSAICPRYIEEMCPKQIYDSVATTFCFSQACGSITAIFLGSILPNDKDQIGLKNTDLWRVIYVYYPICLYVLIFIGFNLFLKDEPVKYLINKKKMSEAKKLIKEIYTDVNVDNFIENIQQTTGQDSSQLKFKDALINEKYRKATWVNIGYIIFHELTAINVITMYSNQMLKEQKNKGGDAFLTPRQGTYCVGIANMLASMLSMQTIKFIGRRTLLIYGHILIALIHASIALFIEYDQDNVVLILILLFLIVYQNSSGPVAWLYAAETTVDVGIGICLLSLWGTVFILSLVTPILMTSQDQGGIGQTNVFYILAVLSVFGSIYSYVMIIETKGLTNKQKKQIFMPEKYKDNNESKQEFT